MHVFARESNCYLRLLQLDRLNEMQKVAVTSDERALLVLAGPGSGKTFTITQRVLYLIEVKNIPPDRILVITFTKDAALSMQNRFMESCNEILPIQFGTFHSLFYHILRSVRSSNNTELLSDFRKKQIFSGIIHNLKQNMSKEEGSEISHNDWLQNCIFATSFYKNTRDKKGTEKHLDELLKTHFWNIFSIYEKQRVREGLLDFDDMIYECFSLLRQNSNALEYWRNRFDAILIDEYQDINQMQFDAIDLLIGKRTSIFAVGDDDQSIYGFRGSDPGLLREFINRYKAKTIKLLQNYRSTKEIVACSFKVIEENTNRFEKELFSLRENCKNVSNEPVSSVVVKKYVTMEEEWEYLLKQFQEKDQDESCCVLFRTNLHMQFLASFLSRNGVAYEMKDAGMDLMKVPIVKDIVSYLRIANGESTGEDFLQIVNKPSRYVSREALAQISLKEEFDIRKTIKKLLTFYEAPMGPSKNAGTYKLLKEFEQDIERMQGLSLSLQFQYILKRIGYETYFKQKNAKAMPGQEYSMLENQEILQFLKEEVRHATDLETFLARLRQKKEASVGKGIVLMTVHRSKGLEFDKVYIPNVNENVFPHGRMPDAATVEEERRVFYVAMTRAKDFLEIMYLTGTRESPRVPSRYLSPILSSDERIRID